MVAVPVLLHRSVGGGLEVSSSTVSRVEEMSTTECSDLGEEFWLPEEFLDDDFFSEEEKAAVAARSESDEEDSLAGLSRRLAGLLGDDGERKPPTAAKVGFLSHAWDCWFFFRLFLYASVPGFLIARSCV